VKKEMKKMLFIFALAVLLLVAFAVPSLALHNPDPQARNCYYCHSTHAGIGPTLFNPNVGAKTAAGVIVNGSPAGIVTASTVCLACHDNTVPAGTSPSVSMGTAPMDIASRWLGNPGLAHGNGRGNYLNENDQRPRYPFQSATYSNTPPAQAYAAIQCTTCHDPHGSKNVYFLREYIVVDGIVMNNSNTYLNGAPINLPVWPVDANGRLYNDFFGQFCATCHSSGRFANHKGGLGNTPTTSVNCDNEHRWSRYQGGTDGLHDNANARGDKKSW